MRDFLDNTIILVLKLARIATLFVFIVSLLNANIIDTIGSAVVFTVITVFFLHPEVRENL